MNLDRQNPRDSDVYFIISGTFIMKVNSYTITSMCIITHYLTMALLGFIAPQSLSISRWFFLKIAININYNEFRVIIVDVNLADNYFRFIWNTSTILIVSPLQSLIIIIFPCVEQMLLFFETVCRRRRDWNKHKVTTLVLFKWNE